MPPLGPADMCVKYLVLRPSTDESLDSSLLLLRLSPAGLMWLLDSSHAR